MPARYGGLFASAFAALVLPLPALAADLSFGGASSATVGTSIAIPVLVDSTDAAMNAVSADIRYPAELLTLTSISKGSLISFWTNEPSFSQAAGSATIEGVIFNPGWTGSGGKVVTLNFIPKKAGSATISFSRGAVLANDGQGTDITKRLGEKTLSIAIAPAPKPAAPKPAKEKEPAAEPEPAATTTATSTPPQAPLPPAISSYTRVVDKDHPFFVSGRTVPLAQVDVILSGCDDGLAFSGLSAASECAEATSRSVSADENGFFVLIWSGDIPAGSYSFTVRATLGGMSSAPSTPAGVVVQGEAVRSLALLFLDNLAILFAVVLAAAGFVALGLGLYFGVRALWRRIRASFTVVHKLQISSEDDTQIDGYIKVLERAASKRELTEEERELYTAMKSYRAYPAEPFVTRLSWTKKQQ